MAADSEVERVRGALLGRIVSGMYPPGLRLPPENDLATEFVCGRSTIREALQALTGMGVVRSRRGSGAMVLDFRKDGVPALLPFYIAAGRYERPVRALVLELFGLRTQLACQAVRLAALYGEASAIAEARAIIARAEDLTHDPAAHGKNEIEFFKTLIAGSGILPAVWLANVFWGPMRELQDMFGRHVGPIPADYQEQMTTLLDLIGQRDVVGAEEHVTRWFESADRRLVPQLEQLFGLFPNSH